MNIFIKIFSYVVIGYLAIWLTLFLHEFTHAFVGWIFGVCSNPFSIGYLPVLKFPMTPLLNNEEREKLNSNKKVLISGSALLTNLLMFILGIILINNINILSYFRIFILLFIVTNFAELTSYITIGAINPISDVKFIIQALKIQKHLIYILGFIVLFTGVYVLNRFALEQGQYGYLIYGLLFYLLLSCSRIILTRP